MMLLRFSRGSRHNKTNSASGYSRSKNGIRKAFFGVFSSQRKGTPGATGRWFASTMRVASIRSISRATDSVACSALSRFESTPAAPGLSSAIFSTSQCASPPSVHSDELTASVSNNSVLPDRGAATMKIGRSSVSRVAGPVACGGGGA